MCGICGKVGFDSVNSTLLYKMTDVIKHRGPDDGGIYISNIKSSGINVGLGHRRLSIIDLSIAGHQPMSNEDDTKRR